MSVLGYEIRRVVGHSMVPTLKDSQVCVFREKPHSINSIVLAELDGQEVVKRVVRIEDDTVWLEGDLTSVHHNAIVNRRAISGVMIWPRRD